MFSFDPLERGLAQENRSRAGGGSRASRTLPSLLGAALRFRAQSRARRARRTDLTQSFSPTCSNINLRPRGSTERQVPFVSTCSLKNFLADAADRELPEARWYTDFLPLHEEQAQEAESLFRLTVA